MIRAESFYENIRILIDSFGEFINNMTADTIIITIMAFFVLVGAIDKIRGNKRGYGHEFEKGFELIGPLAMIVSAVIASTPMLSRLILTIFKQLFTYIGIDVSMLPAVILGPDLGAYYLAMELADNESIGNFSGLIIASILGPTISFTIPMAFSTLPKKDYSVISAGILIGLTTVPIGCICGGIVMNLIGYELPMEVMCINCIPVIVITLMIIIGICVLPIKLIKWFVVIGKFITIIITVLLTIAIFQQLTGIMLPYFYTMSIPDESTGLTGLDSGLLLSGQIGIVLAGAFPMLLWISRILEKSIEKIGKKLNIEKEASIAFIASLANVIPAINTFHKMGDKGKFLNMAFIVTGGAVFGDFIGFTASVNQKMIIPMIIGKLVSGILAFIIANILADNLLPVFSNKVTETE